MILTSLHIYSRQGSIENGNSTYSLVFKTTLWVICSVQAPVLKMMIAININLGAT